MQHHRNLNRVSAAAALTLVALGNAGCAPQSPDDISNDILTKIEWHSVKPNGIGDGPFVGPVAKITSAEERASCRDHVWWGSRGTLSRPFLGLYQDGHISPAKTPDQLTADDLALELKKVLANNRGGPEIGLVNQRSGYGIPSNGRSTTAYLQSEQRPSSGSPVENDVLLRAIVKAAGAPRYVQSSSCGQSLSIVYGDPDFPWHQAPGPSACGNGTNFLRINITSGTYHATNPQGCKK